MNKFYIHVPELKDKLAVLAKFQMMGVKYYTDKKALDELGAVKTYFIRYSESFEPTWKNNNTITCADNHQIGIDEKKLEISDFLKCDTIEQACELVEPVKDTINKIVKNSYLNKDTDKIINALIDTVNKLVDKVEG